jgi:hypothetical protein
VAAIALANPWYSQLPQWRLCHILSMDVAQKMDVSNIENCMFKVVPDNSTQNYAQSCFNISIT